jgi:hypothetical protein
MPRVPRAATALIGQVTDAKKRAKAEPHGDPDGLNVYRSISFDKTTSKWLTPILENSTDPRIVALGDDGGRLVVTFSPKVDADRRDAFALDEPEAESADGD